MTTTTVLEVKIYVGTYAKYNNGSIQGQYIDLIDLDKKEFYDLCQEIHSDEEDPEFMFQDTDTESKVLRDLISESGIDEDFWSLKEEMKELSENSLEAFEIYVNNGYDPEISCFEENYFCYLNEYNVNEAFGQYYMDITGDLMEMPKHLQAYFDFEAFGRDLLINDYWEENGHIFSNR
jgi:antirestriction protein